MRDIIDLVGRIFLATIFIFEAFDSIRYFPETQAAMTLHGVTWNQDLLLYGAIFLLTTGGLMVLTGYRSTLGAVLLLMYWVPMTFIVHDFWNLTKAEGLREQSILFMKNFAVIGGLMMLAGKGSGRYSIRKLLATTRVK